MATIKTPEQIAAEITERIWESFDGDFSDVQQAIREGIEADRAQRVLTESEWTERHRDLDETDLRGVIVEDWGDATETPSQAIIRLNAEAMEYADLHASALAQLTELENKLARIRRIVGA